MRRRKFLRRVLVLAREEYQFDKRTDLRKAILQSRWRQCLNKVYIDVVVTYRDKWRRSLSDIAAVGVASTVNMF